MNINNDNLSDREKLLDTNTKIVRKADQRTLNNQDESLVDNNNNSGILYKNNISSETGSGSNISISSTRRGSFVLSDSESNRSSTSTLLAQSNTRRRALSTTSRSKDRFSMLEFGSSRIDGVNTRLLSPTRHSMAFDNRFNSLEDREWTIDRERIGNAGKGFGDLVNDEDGKDSIADLIADVKDEDAVKLALITQRQRHAGQKNRIHNPDEKIAQKDGNLNFEFYLSETTLSNSRMCKQLLENKYHVLFKIINNNGIYNPLTIVKNRRNDLAREGSDHSMGLSEKYSGGNSNRLISGRIKSRGSLPRRKESSIWYVSHMEIIKDYEQKNTFDQVCPGKQIVHNDNHESQNNDDLYYQKRRQKYPQLSQIFSPPTAQEIQEMSSLEEKEENGGKKHSNLNSITTTSQGKEDSHGKSKKWPINLFKRKDKKHKDESDVENVQEVPNDSSVSRADAKSVSDSSSDQTPRSSLEEARFSFEKGKDSIRQVNSEGVTHNDERIYYELGSNDEKDALKVPEERHNHNRIPADDWTDDAFSRRNSLDTSIGHSNNSSARNSVDLESDIAVVDLEIYSSRRGSLNIGDKFKSGDEQHEDNRSYHLPIENKTAEYSESEEEYEDETELVGETVLVNLDILPQELINLVTVYQEQGIVNRNVDNRRFAELDIGLNENFKFHKLISYGVDLLDLQVSLVCDNAEDSRSLNQQDSDKIKRCDEYIEEATKLIEVNEMLLAERIEFVKDNNYVSNGSHIFKSLDIPFSNSPMSMNSPNTPAFSFDNISQQNLPSRSVVAKYKMSIEEGIDLLNNKLVDIEDTVNKLENQHTSFTEEMKTILDKIEEMTTDANNHELKLLEDEIHLLIGEKEKTPWLDVFYLMMSYVLAGIMLMFWFIVACFKLFKKILLLPNRIWKLILLSKSFRI